MIAHFSFAFLNASTAYECQILFVGFFNDLFPFQQDGLASFHGQYRRLDFS